MLNDGKGHWAIRDRKIRVNGIVKTLKKAKESNVQVDLDRFVAEVSLNVGLSSRKIKEYVAELELAGFVKLDDSNNIRTIEYVFDD